MAEELVLDDPIVTPPASTTTYRVVSMLLDREVVTLDATAPGLVSIRLRDNHDVETVCQYLGDEAIDLMKWMNTANFSTNSMHKRVLQKLTNDGKLPPGTVTGTPDPPVVVLDA